MTGSCDDLADGYYPVVTDCAKYVQCYGGRNVTLSCANGTTFNIATGRCLKPTACSQNVIRKAPSQGTPGAFQR